MRKVTAVMLRKYPDLMSVKDIQKILHIGRSKAYIMLKCGEIPSLRIGAKYRIPKAYFVEYLNGTA